MKQKQWLVRRGKDLFLHLQVQPRAKQTEIIGLHGPYLKIKLAALPAENAANEELMKFLADKFGIPQQNITLLQGRKSHYKIIKVESPAQIPQIIADLL